MICNNFNISSTTKKDVLNLNIRDKLRQWGCKSLLQSENLIQNFHDDVKLFITLSKDSRVSSVNMLFIFNEIALKVVSFLALKVVLHYFSPVL